MTKYPTFPTVLCTVWPALQEAGWRWHSNRESEDVVVNRAFYDQLCNEYGEGNVAIGQFWDENAMRPQPDETQFGFYVRDVSDQVKTLRQSMQSL